MRRLIGVNLFESMKREIQLLNEAEPGVRFVERYERSHDGNTSRLVRWLRVAASVLVAATGIFLMPAPGPGWLVFILGLALLGGEWRVVARLLDQGELLVRRGWRWLKRWWENSSFAGRVGVIALGCALTIAGVWACWKLMFG